jgi:hypothetical protein
MQLLAKVRELKLVAALRRCSVPETFVTLHRLLSAGNLRAKT